MWQVTYVIGFAARWMTNFMEPSLAVVHDHDEWVKFCEENNVGAPGQRARAAETHHQAGREKALAETAELRGKVQVLVARLRALQAQAA